MLSFTLSFLLYIGFSPIGKNRHIKENACKEALTHELSSPLGSKLYHDIPISVRLPYKINRAYIIGITNGGDLDLIGIVMGFINTLESREYVLNRGINLIITQYLE